MHRRPCSHFKVTQEVGKGMGERGIQNNNNNNNNNKGLKNNNNNTHICIAPYGRNFRGAVARECASESEKREEIKPERKGMSLA